MFVDSVFVGKVKVDSFKFHNLKINNGFMKNNNGSIKEFVYDFDLTERSIFVSLDDYSKDKFKNALLNNDFSVLKDYLVFDSVKSLKSKEEDKSYCAYFDGSTRYVLAGTRDEFKKGPFSIYVDFVPFKDLNNQQIIGHFDWDIYQQNDKITFQIGRMNNNKGAFHSISYSIDDDFFNKSHSLVAIYNPFNNKTIFDGYIELFVDSNFAGRTYFKNDVLWSGYSKQDLSLGHTAHSSGKHPKFEGLICDVKFVYDEIISEHKNYRYSTSGKEFPISITGNGSLDKLVINKKK
jgi:hypothetical protein